MSNAANSHFTVTFPTGTTFTDGRQQRRGWSPARRSAAASAPVGLTAECYPGTSTARVDAQHQGSGHTFGGVTNQPAPGTKTLATVATTSDPASVNSSAGSAWSRRASRSARSRPDQRHADHERPAGAPSTSPEVHDLSDRRRDVQRRQQPLPPSPSPPARPSPMASAARECWGVSGTAVGGCFAPVGLTPRECYPGFNRTRVAAHNTKSHARTFGGVTNPPSPGTKTLATARHHSDTQSVNSAEFGVLAGQSHSTRSRSSLAEYDGAATTTYTVGFVTSALGRPRGTANSRMRSRSRRGRRSRRLPGDVHDLTANADVGGCGRPSGLTVDATLFSRPVAAGHAIRITFTGITNPAAPAPIRSARPPRPTCRRFRGPLPGGRRQLGAGDHDRGVRRRSRSPPASRARPSSVRSTAATSCRAPRRSRPPRARARGTHFRVRAIDGAGNADPTPATTYVRRRASRRGTPSAMPTVLADAHAHARRRSRCRSSKRRRGPAGRAAPCASARRAGSASR